jgi:anti-sigma B factor antagonist
MGFPLLEATPHFGQTQPLEPVATSLSLMASDQDDILRIVGADRRGSRLWDLILRVAGELNLASRGLIESAVLAAIPTAYTVIPDLTDLTFCDSSGLTMFVIAKERAEAEGTALKLRNLNRAVARILEISGLDRVLDINEGRLDRSWISQLVASVADVVGDHTKCASCSRCVVKKHGEGPLGLGRAVRYSGSHSHRTPGVDANAP